VRRHGRLVRRAEQSGKQRLPDTIGNHRRDNSRIRRRHACTDARVDNSTACGRELALLAHGGDE
jgi:hypothetical protein